MMEMEESTTVHSLKHASCRRPRQCFGFGNSKPPPCTIQHFLSVIKRVQDLYPYGLSALSCVSLLSRRTGIRETADRIACFPTPWTLIVLAGVNAARR